MFALLGTPFFTFHDRDVVPEGANLREFQRNLAEMTDYFAGKDHRLEREAALGHRESLQPSALHGGRRDQSRPRCFRPCRRAGEKRDRRDAPARRRQLRALGRPRGLRDAAQHRHEARTRADGPVPVDGRRLQAQDRLQGRHPRRAEAAGADQAPIRLRRRDRVSASSSASGWRRRSRSISRSATRCSPSIRSSTRSRPPPRSAFWARSTPTATTINRAGTPTSSPTTRPNSCRRSITS